MNSIAFNAKNMIDSLPVKTRASFNIRTKESESKTKKDKQKVKRLSQIDYECNDIHKKAIKKEKEGDLRAAEKYYLRALEARKLSAGPNASSVAVVHINLSMLLERRGMTNDAKKNYKAALSILKYNREACEDVDKMKFLKKSEKFVKRRLDEMESMEKNIHGDQLRSLYPFY